MCFTHLPRPEYVRNRGADLVPLKDEDIRPIASHHALAQPSNNPLSNEEPPSSRQPSFSPLHVETNSGSNDAVQSNISLPVIPPSNPVVPMKEDRQISLPSEPTYDDFLNDLSSSPALFDSAGYDDFDFAPTPPAPPPPVAAAVSPLPAAAREMSPSDPYGSFNTDSAVPLPAAAIEMSPSDPYGSFDTDSADAATPTKPHLQSTSSYSAGGYGNFDGEDGSPSRLSRLTEITPINREFELLNANNIADFLQRYDRYDMQALGRSRPSPAIEEQDEGVSRLSLRRFLPGEEQKKRLSYIENKVADLYGSSNPLDLPLSPPPDVDLHTIPHIRESMLSQSAESAPLSPDALSSFSNFDPEAMDRNREVIRATERLIREVIPALSLRLSRKTPAEVERLDLAHLFHFHGVNIRHMGLVRHHIKATLETSLVRTALLLQIVCRTLKNLCRDFQRRWMRSERSSSEQGIFLIISEFLNLMVGRHINSEKFWLERVIVGILQRFGKCALDGNESHLQNLRKQPFFMRVRARSVIYPSVN
jgi:hypothetical protein